MLIGIFLSILFSVSSATEAKTQTRFNDSLSDEAFNTQQFPINYTFEKSIDLQFDVSVVLMSPDEKWIVYTTRNYNGSEPPNKIYYKLKDSKQNPSIYTFGTNESENIGSCWDCIRFNKKGDLLFFGTNKGILYMCNFPSNKINSVCDIKIDLRERQYDIRRIYSIDVNEFNQVALVWSDPSDFTICIIEIKDGNLVLKDSFSRFGDTFSYWIKWHPIDQQMLISLSFNFVKSVMSLNIINTTLRSNSTLDINNFQQDTFQLDVSKDGQIVFVGSCNGVYAFQYFEGSLSTIGNIKDKVYQRIQVSRDGKLLIGYLISQKTIQLLQIKKTTQIQSFTRSHSITSFNKNKNNRTQIKNKNQTIKQISVYLRLISSLPSIQNVFYASPDNNFILAVIKDASKINLYRMCPHKTYLLNIECPACSENCSDCHFTQSTCLSCLNNSQVLENNICYPCSKYVVNCSTCSNQSNCLSCTDFYYLSSNQCKMCDIYGVCKSCTSETNCTKCDSDKGYKEDPVNLTCQCKQNYSLFDNNCINCTVLGCLFCEQDRKCKKCDSDKGYIENSEDGNCKCQTIFSSVDGKCIECNIVECIKCKQANKCIQCSEEKYELSPDGKCIQIQKSLLNLYILIGSGVGGVILIGIIVVVYCKCKNKSSKSSSLIESREQNEQDEDRHKEIYGSRLIRESVQRRSIEQRVSRSVIEERIEEPLLNQEKQKVKYSDEEKIRLRQLQNQSFVSN